MIRLFQGFRILPERLIPPLNPVCMRILLISANIESFPEPVFPIGAFSVARSFLRQGAQVRVFDMRHGSIVSLHKEIARFRPDRIGLSLRNVDNASYPCTRSYLPFYASVIKAVRAFSRVPVILGGSAFSLFPDEISRYLAADGGIRGEGENTLHLFRELNGGRIAQAEPSVPGDMSMPVPLTEIFPGMRKYRTVGIQTARGCPNRCIYCTYPFLEGTVIRKRPPEEVAEELKTLHRWTGAGNFFIVDSLFNADEEHMVRVLERVVHLNLPVRLSCYLQPKMSDPAILRLMRRAGFASVDFGTDSGSAGVLSALKKPFTRDDIRKVSDACRKAGMDFCHSLIFGGPGETPETIRETVSLMDEVSPRAVIPMTGIRIYPGTEIERIARREGFISTDESLLNPVFYFAGMEPGDMLRSAYGMTAGRNSWFFPGKKDWSSSLGFRALSFFYRKGPLWRTFRKQDER